MARLPQGQNLFNVIIGFLVVVVVFNLIWVNWSLIHPRPISVTRTAECDLNCVTQTVKQMLAAELANLALTRQSAATTTTSTETATVAPGCDQNCVESIVEEKLAALPTASVVPTKTQTSQSGKATAPTTSFVNLSTGSAAGGDWMAVSGTEFWLETTLYGSNVTVTWQGNLAIKDGNGIGYVRLYDLTNHRAVDGSQVSVSGTDTISFYSSSLSIWRGQNQYRIEAKSTTGYEVTVSTPRLKLVSQ